MIFLAGQVCLCFTRSQTFFLYGDTIKFNFEFQRPQLPNHQVQHLTCAIKHLR